MDTQYKTWMLAVGLFYWLKASVLEAASKDELTTSAPFRRIGADIRTVGKYWFLLERSGYLVDKGYGKFAIREDIEQCKPETLGDLIKRLKNDSKQTTLAEQGERALSQDVLTIKAAIGVPAKQTLLKIEEEKKEDG